MACKVIYKRDPKGNLNVNEIDYVKAVNGKRSLLFDTINSNMSNSLDALGKYNIIHTKGFKEWYGDGEVDVNREPMPIFSGNKMLFNNGKQTKLLGVIDPIKLERSKLEDAIIKVAMNTKEINESKEKAIYFIKSITNERPAFVGAGLLKSTSNINVDKEIRKLLNNLYLKNDLKLKDVISEIQSLEKKVAPNTSKYPFEKKSLAKGYGVISTLKKMKDLMSSNKDLFNVISASELINISKEELDSLSSLLGSKIEDNRDIAYEILKGFLDDGSQYKLIEELDLDSIELNNNIKEFADKYYKIDSDHPE